MHYKEPLTEIKNGFGYYGCLLSSTDGEKVQCAICGGLYGELSKHITPKHGITAREYKEKYGLAYSTALISEKIRESRKQTTLVWVEKMKRQHGADWRMYLRTMGQKGNLARRTTAQPRLTLESKNKRGTCPDQLLDRIIKVKEEIGHTPSKDEFIAATGTQRYVHLIYKTFGSWTGAVSKAGLRPKPNMGNLTERVGNQQKPYYEDEELLEYLRIFYEQNNKIPTETDCRRGMIPPSTTYARRFGSLVIARERAGIYDKPTKYGVIPA